MKEQCFIHMYFTYLHFKHCKRIGHFDQLQKKKAFFHAKHYINKLNRDEGTPFYEDKQQQYHNFSVQKCRDGLFDQNWRMVSFQTKSPQR